MTRLNAQTFYTDLDEAPQQGDILLGAVSRVVGDDGFCPTRWEALDEQRAVLAAGRTQGNVTLPAVRVAAGRALVMVCTHDCGLDKEFNAAVEALLADGESVGLGSQAAEEITEKPTDLDRNFSVSPLVDPSNVRVAGRTVDRNALMGGQVIGYLPVPELQVDGRVVIPESVVDLTYRSTLDRLAYTKRLSCVSEAARSQLRFAMAKLDVPRTPSLELQLSEAVGQKIKSARVSKRNPLVVALKLEDDSTIELMMKPGSPLPGPTSRTRRSVARSEQAR